MKQDRRIRWRTSRRRRWFHGRRRTYFSSVDSLLVEAPIDGAVPTAEDVFDESSPLIPLNG